MAEQNAGKLLAAKRRTEYKKCQCGADFLALHSGVIKCKKCVKSEQNKRYRELHKSGVKIVNINFEIEYDASRSDYFVTENGAHKSDRYFFTKAEAKKYIPALKKMRLQEAKELAAYEAIEYEMIKDDDSDVILFEVYKMESGGWAVKDNTSNMNQIISIEDSKKEAMQVANGAFLEYRETC